MISTHLVRKVACPVVSAFLMALSGAAALSQTVIATVPAQEGSQGIPMTMAVNPLTRLVYIAGNGVEVVDQRTNQPVTTFSVGQNQLAGVAINPVTRKLYVADYDTGVYIVDLTTNTVVGQFPMAIVRSLTYNPVTNLVYALDNVDNIWVLNGTTGALVKEIQTPAQSGFSVGFSITINPATNLLYIPLGTSPGSMYVVNAETNAVATVPLQGVDPGFAAVDPLRNIVYITDINSNDQQDGQVEVMNGATNADIALVGGFPILPEDLSVNPVTRLVYMANANGNVYVIDGKTNTLTSTVISVGTNPIQTTLDLVHGLLYVGNTAEFQPGTQSVSVISLK